MKISFDVGTVRPDQRAFRQQSIELSPEQRLIVEVEIDDSHEVDSIVDGTLIINLAGLKAIADQFDLLFLGASPEGEVEDDDFEDQETSSDPDEDGWGEDGEDESDSWGEEVETPTEDEW